MVIDTTAPDPLSRRSRKKTRTKINNIVMTAMSTAMTVFELLDVGSGPP
ncbi:MAG: hypothetical protein ACI8V4_003789 [Ilumatobacter sp.]|jgi:hypothetical protein